jgi:hypothetical protein
MDEEDRPYVCPYETRVIEYRRFRDTKALKREVTIQRPPTTKPDTIAGWYQFDENEFLREQEAQRPVITETASRLLGLPPYRRGEGTTAAERAEDTNYLLRINASSLGTIMGTHGYNTDDKARAAGYEDALDYEAAQRAGRVATRGANYHMQRGISEEQEGGELIEKITGLKIRKLHGLPVLESKNWAAMPDFVCLHARLAIEFKSRNLTYSDFVPPQDYYEMWLQMQITGLDILYVEYVSKADRPLSGPPVIVMRLIRRPREPLASKIMTDVEANVARARERRLFHREAVRAAAAALVRKTTATAAEVPSDGVPTPVQGTGSAPAPMRHRRQQTRRVPGAARPRSARPRRRSVRRR